MTDRYVCREPDCQRAAELLGQIPTEPEAEPAENVTERSDWSDVEVAKVPDADA